MGLVQAAGLDMNQEQARNQALPLPASPPLHYATAKKKPAGFLQRALCHQCI